jgi:hypothetical protein
MVNMLSNYVIGHHIAMSSFLSNYGHQGTDLLWVPLSPLLALTRDPCCGYRRVGQLDTLYQLPLSYSGPAQYSCLFGERSPGAGCGAGCGVGGGADGAPTWGYQLCIGNLKEISRRLATYLSILSIFQHIFNVFCVSCFVFQHMKTQRSRPPNVQASSCVLST